MCWGSLAGIYHPCLSHLAQLSRDTRIQCPDTPTLWGSRPPFSPAAVSKVKPFSSEVESFPWRTHPLTSQSRMGTEKAEEAYVSYTGSPISSVPSSRRNPGRSHPPQRLGPVLLGVPGH